MSERAPRRLAATLAGLALLAAAGPAPAAAADPGADASRLRDLPGAARLGLWVQDMTPELREHFDAPADRGLLVTRVERGRPAERAGVAVGDVILEAGGEPQRRAWDLVRVVARAPAGENLPLRVLREGRVETRAAVPDGAALPWPDTEAFVEWLERGIQLGSEELRQQLEELQRRLEELERRLDEERRIREGAERT